MLPTLLRSAVAAFIAALALLASTSTAGAADAAAHVLAQGKGVVVTQGDLDEAFINLRAVMASQGRNVTEQQRPTIERQLLEKLVLTKILLGMSTDADRAKAREKVDKIIADEKAKAKSEARFEAQIRAAGMSPQTFESQLLERATCEEVMERELRSKLDVSPEKVRAYYDEHSRDFRQPERVRLRQIVFTLRGTGGNPMRDSEKAERKALAEQLVTRLRNGEDFAALARQYSDDPAGRERGGEYIFPVGKMIPEFELAVAGLATNQIGDVVTTPFAYHVVQVLERLPGEEIPFDTVAPQIKARMEIEATQALVPEFQKRLFGEAGVTFTKAN